jgi:ribosomal protein S18 acetylase RimI-like enzyme
MAPVLELAKTVWEDWACSTAITRQVVDLGHPFLVAKAQSKLAGYMFGMVAADKTRGHVLSITIDPHWRHQGIGTQLVRAAVEAFRRHKVTEITAEISPDNANSQGIFSKLGFERCELRRDYYGPGLNFYTYKRIL